MYSLRIIYRFEKLREVGGVVGDVDDNTSLDCVLIGRLRDTKHIGKHW